MYSRQHPLIGKGNPGRFDFKRSINSDGFLRIGRGVIFRRRTLRGAWHVGVNLILPGVGGSLLKSLAPVLHGNFGSLMVTFGGHVRIAPTSEQQYLAKDN